MAADAGTASPCFPVASGPARLHLALVVNPRAEHFGAKEIDLRDVSFTPGILALIPAEFARRHCVVAIQDSPQRVVVAMADPSDLDAIDALHTRLQRDVEICVAEGRQLNEFIRRFYGSEGAP